MTSLTKTAQSTEEQLDMFPNIDMDVREIKWFEVNKVPTINWLHDHASRAFNALSDLDEKVFIKVWKAVGIANYMFLRGIEPKGFIHRRHHHILHQIGAQTQVDKIKLEFLKRGLDSKFGLDISFKS